MIKTPLCDMLGIKYPIIQAGMGPFETNKLAAAVSNAGGIGLISHAGLGLFEKFPNPAEKMRADIKAVKKLTDKNFGVNIRVAKIQVDAPMCLDAVIDEMEKDQDVGKRLKLITTSAGDPIPPSQQLTESGVKEKYGLKHFHVVASTYMAQKALGAGCDGVIAMGHEAGGHIAYYDVNTIVLLPEVVKIAKVPVVATGGFCDGKGLAAALILGAQGIQMGTRFIATKECEFRDEFKQLILKSRDVDTVATAGVFGPIRLIKNKYTEYAQAKVSETIVEGVRKGLTIDEARKTLADPDKFSLEDASRYELIYRGDTEQGAVLAGEVVGRIDNIPTVKDLIERIMREAEEVIQELPKKFIT